MDGAWGTWGSWGSCNYYTGKKERTRICDNPAPLYGGANCTGSNQEKSNCIGKDF